MSNLRLFIALFIIPSALVALGTFTLQKVDRLEVNTESKISVLSPMDVQDRLSVTTTDEASLPCPVMTATQRDALTPVSGDCVFNDDDDELNIYDGTAWVAAGGSGGGINQWAATTDYEVGDVIWFATDNNIYRALSTFTSGASFDRVNWVELSPPRDVGQFIKNPSFEDPTIDDEWTCTNCSILQVAGGTHGSYSMQITWSGAGCAVFAKDTTGLSTTGASSYSRFMVSTEDTGITYVGMVDGSQWSPSSQTILPVASIGDNWNDVNTGAFPMGATSTGVAFCNFTSSDVLRVDFVEGGGVTRYSGQPTSQVQAEEVLYAAGSSQGAVTSANNIQFTEVSDPYGLWDGDEFTPDENALYLFTGSGAFTASVADQVFFLNTDGTNEAMSFRGTTSGSVGFSISKTLSAGQVVTIRLSANATISNSTVNHWLRITKISTKQSLTGVCSGGPLKCENDFYGSVSGSGAQDLSEDNWISCSGASAPYTCTFNTALDLTLSPICYGLVQDGSSLRTASITSLTSTQVVFNTFNTSTQVGSSVKVNFGCHKRGVDRTRNHTMRASLEGLNFSTSEIWTGGYDLTSGKPIYKRCFAVTSDITTTGLVADWNLTGVTPIGLPQYTGNGWAFSKVQNTDGSNNMLLYYEESSGDVLVSLAGGYKVGAGTRICMEYIYD